MISVKVARAVAVEVMRRLRIRGPRGTRRPRAWVVGSVRRTMAEVDAAVHDVDLLVVADLTRVELAPARPGDRVASVTQRAAGARRRELVVGWVDQHRAVRVRVDLFGARSAELPWAMFALSSSRDYQVRVRAVAARRGLLLNQYGLWVRATGRPAPGSASVRTERGVAKAIGVRWRPAAQRR